ncbi:MAG: hypothetical protein R3C53_16395 [Pirellulaceae bacterium]
MRQYSTFLCVLTLCAAPLYAQTPAEQSLSKRAAQASEMLREAKEQHERGEYEAARRLATEAAKLATDSVVVQQAAAEVLYLSGYSKDSLPLFDRVVELRPEAAPQNWQRGIALCSCGDFERGAEQFKTHHDVNPDDVENSAWYFLCIAKTQDIAAARKTVIPSRGDGRQPMMSILAMLKGEQQPADVLKAAEAGGLSGRSLKMSKFYADLYVGLYYDALGDEKQAIKALQRSLTYDISGYMVDTARVYLQDRFPDATKGR